MSSSIATATFIIPFVLPLLLTTATAAISHHQEFHLTILKAKELVSQAKDWAAGNSTLENHPQVISYHPNEKVNVSLDDCVKLYDESEFRLEQLISAVLASNHTWEDANAWLSGVHANHRSCVDDWSDGSGKGVEPFPEFGNLTNLINEALAYSYERMEPMMGIHKVSAHRTPKPVDGLLASWNASTSKADFVVAKDGSGTHTTINEALAAVGRMGMNRTSRVIIYVKAGVYDEKVEIEKTMRFLTFVGDGINRTIVTGSRNVVDGSTTMKSATFGVSADGFWARDMTFENTAGPAKHQAVALRTSSDRAIFYRCSFKGYQDTLYTHSLRQFYRDCSIHGTVDFIFGDAAVVFQNCDILIRKPMEHQSNMVTAQGRDNLHTNTGISIQGCRIAPGPDFVSVNGSFKSYLGRPWKVYSRTVVMKSDLDGMIDPKGWSEWRGDFALATLFYGEYHNSGKGAPTTQRVSWSGYHVLRSEKEVRPYSVSKLIQGESWIPRTGVPFSHGV